MKFLFIADRFEKIKPKSDSTLSLVRRALARKHKVFWASSEDIQLTGYGVGVVAAEVLGCPPDSLPSVGSNEKTPLEKFETIFIRKDPPFDGSYVKLCWLLGLLERKIFMINRPSLLLRFHEKLLPLEAMTRGFLEPKDVIPTWLNDLEGAQAYVVQEKIERVVTKPFLGFGGSDVTSLNAVDFLKTKDLSAEDPRLVQPFQSEIALGDFRVFFLDGTVLAHFVRVPKEGDFISNLAQGGRAETRALSERQRDVLQRLGKFLKSSSVTLAGADLIGDKISEVNVTSPTGLQSLWHLEAKDYAENIIQFAERNVVLFPF
jgi:glutathione synthase